MNQLPNQVGGAVYPHAPLMDNIILLRWEQYLWGNLNAHLASLDLEDCIVYIKDREQDALVQRCAYGKKNIANQKVLSPLTIKEGEGITGSVALSGEPQLISNTLLDDRYVIDDEFRYSELAYPIYFRNELVGIIDSEHSEKSFYTTKHLKQFQQIAQLSRDYLTKEFTLLMTDWSFRNMVAQQQQFDILQGQLAQEHKVILSSTKGFKVVDQQDIIYIKAEGSYTKFVLTNNRKVLVSKNLKTYEQLVSPLNFVRVHHSYLVNKRFISEYDKEEEMFTTAEGHKVPLSSRRKQAVLAHFI